ncbi:MAG: hypothetical protein AAF213_09180 [Pseudomonadota bacterium]
MSDAPPIAGLLATGARSGGTGQTGLPLPLGTVNLEALPSSLQSLNRAVTLSGVLSAVSQGGGGGQNPDSGGLFRLSTASGEVLLRTPLNLRPGQGFLLQIPAGNPPQGGVLLTTNNTMGAAGPSTAGAGAAGTGVPAQALAGAGTSAPAGTPTGPVTVTAPVTLPSLGVGLTTSAQILPVIPSTTPGAPGTIASPTGAAPGAPGTPSASAASANATTQATTTPSPSAQGANAATGQPGGAGTGTPLANVPNNMASTLLASLLSDANSASATARQLTADGRAAQNAPNTGSFGGTGATAGGSNAATAGAQAFGQPFGQANNLGDIRILGIARPGQALPPTPSLPGTGPTGGAAGSAGSTGNSPAPPTIITATVVQASADGPTLLRFGEQMMLLQARGELPPGTRLQIALPTALASAFADAPDPFFSTGRWSALQETTQFLQAVNPTAAQALTASVPQIGSANLGTTMVFFMAALRLGDMRAWLGENTIRSLERFGGKDILDRLGSDFSRLAQQADEVLPNNWRPISVPMAHQGDIGLLQFYIKPVNPDGERQAPEEEAGDPDAQDNGTRFLIDMDMSELGRMQVDGLAQPGRVDVILRSMTSFPTEMRQELQSVFRDLLDARGMEGGINFRHHGEGWIKLARQNWQQAPSADDAPPPLTA